MGYAEQEGAPTITCKLARKARSLRWNVGGQKRAQRRNRFCPRVRAEDLALQSFNGTGRLTFNEASLAETCRVEWAPSLRGRCRIADEPGRQVALCPRNVLEQGGGYMRAWKFSESIFKMAAGLLVLLPLVTGAEPGDEWQPRSRLPQGNMLYAVAWSGSQ